MGGLLHYILPILGIPLFGYRVRNFYSFGIRLRVESFRGSNNIRHMFYAGNIGAIPIEAWATQIAPMRFRSVPPFI